ncbi:MAG: periplasmic-type flagellar collar protein FlbB [Spirochaetota bacterium]
MKVSEKSKVFYLLIMIIFLVSAGLFWLDFLGLVNLKRYYRQYVSGEEESVLYASGDEPSLIELEEFQKEQERLKERIAELDRREARLLEMQKEIEREQEKIEEKRQGLELERKKFEEEKNQYSGYRQNVIDLATKIQSMPPQDSVEIMVNWEEPLIIDVLRQMDDNAEEAGATSITSYLISLMPREKASRIMYLMTQL